MQSTVRFNELSDAEKDAAQMMFMNTAGPDDGYWYLLVDGMVLSRNRSPLGLTLEAAKPRRGPGIDLDVLLRLRDRAGDNPHAKVMYLGALEALAPTLIEDALRYRWAIEHGHLVLFDGYRLHSIIAKSEADAKIDRARAAEEGRTRRDAPK